MNTTTTEIIFKYLADTHGMAYHNLISIASENYYNAFACDKWTEEITPELERLDKGSKDGKDMATIAGNLNTEQVREAYENGYIDGIRTVEKFIREILEIVEHAEDTNFQKYALI